MPYYYKRNCPICQKVGIQDISRHLRFVHKLSSEERKSYLKSKLYTVENGSNVHTNNKQSLLNETKILPPAQVIEELSNELVKEKPSKSSSNTNAEMCNETVKGNPTKTVTEKNMKIDNTWTAHSYTGLKFKHPFSMQVVGPSVEKLILCVKFSNHPS